MRALALSASVAVITAGCAAETGADLTVEPATLDFGVVQVGQATIGIAASDKLALSNGSARHLYVHTFSIADAGDGTFLTDDGSVALFPLELAPGDGPVEVTIGVAMNAPGPGDQDGVARFEVTSRDASCSGIGADEACSDEEEQVVDVALRVSTER